MTNTNKCLMCSKDISQIDGKRAKLYCSDACRKAYKRKTDIIPLTDKSLTDKSITDTINGQPLTENEKQGITTQGICHGCGKEVSNICCICHSCITKGVTHESLGLDITKCD